MEEPGVGQEPVAYRVTDGCRKAAIDPLNAVQTVGQKRKHWQAVEALGQAMGFSAGFRANCSEVYGGFWILRVEVERAFCEVACEAPCSLAPRAFRLGQKLLHLIAYSIAEHDFRGVLLCATGSCDRRFTAVKLRTRCLSAGVGG
jgi:hypothetical protein